jgi:hypothetical protein
LELSTPDIIGVVIATIANLICICIFGVKMQRDVDEDERKENNRNDS